MTAQNGTAHHNGELPPIRTETIQPRPGALELQRVIAARQTARAPDPEDVAALLALQPPAGPAGPSLLHLDSAALIEQLHSLDPDVRAHAWETMSPLLTEPADTLDVVSVHDPDPPPLSWIVPRWMPDCTVTVLSGPGEAGKSRIALQLAVAFAIGTDQFIWPSGQRPPLSPRAPKVLESGPVVFAAWETRKRAWQNRLADACGRNAAEIGNLDNRIHYLNMRPAGGLWGAEHGRHISTTGAWLDAAWALRQYVERVQARMLVIDPLAAAFVQNENDRALVRAFLSALDQWAEDANCAVLIISHPAKTGDDAQSGNTDWRNGVQAVWELQLQKTDGRFNSNQPRTLRVDKLNEGKKPASMHVDYEGGRFVEVNESYGRSHADTSDL